MSNTPTTSGLKGNQWGSPDSWDKAPEYFKQQIRKQKVARRMAQKELKNSWGKPNTWNTESSNPGYQGCNVKNFWGNPFGWPESLGNNHNPYQVKSSNPNANVWASSYQANNSSSWVGSNNNGSSSLDSLRGDQFFQFLKEKEVDDEVICILVKQGINSMQILRLCSQQALATRGIKLSEVIKLKSF